MTLTRRGFLGAAGALTTLTLWPGTTLAAADDTRLLVIGRQGARSS